MDFNGLAYSGFNNAYFIAQSTGQYSGRFGSFVNGIGTNGATNVIPMMAGFWMQANVAAPSIGFPNTARLTNYANPSMQRVATQTMLRLQLTAQTTPNAVTDEAVVYFPVGATNGIDANIDATSPPSPIQLLTSINGNNFTVNGLPISLLEGSDPIVLPLVPRVTGTTPALLAITENTLPNGSEVALEDTWTGNLIRFNGTTPVALGNGGEIEGRYRLVITGNVTSVSAKNELNVNVFPNPAKDVVNVNIPTGETIKAELINNLGQKVGNYTLSESGAINVANLTRGIYSLRCISNGKTSVFKITLR